MTAATIDRWHAMLESRDLTALDEILATDAVFHSPIVHAPQEGKEVTKLYLTAAFQVLSGADFQYVRELISETDAILEFTAEIDGVHINGVDMIHWNAEGRIDDFKVMIRPLKAVNLLHRMMGGTLEEMKAG
ncbi:MAG: nuclear transport factor 2 family protein [Candidatus Binatia bacterium]